MTTCKTVRCDNQDVVTVSIVGKLSTHNPKEADDPM